MILWKLATHGFEKKCLRQGTQCPSQISHYISDGCVSTVGIVLIMPACPAPQSKHQSLHSMCKERKKKKQQPKAVFQGNNRHHHHKMSRHISPFFYQVPLHDNKLIPGRRHQNKHQSYCCQVAGCLLHHISFICALTRFDLASF